MLLSNARNKNQGFTLIETLIILVIIGVLSAIAAPSFLSMFNRNKVNDALDQVRGALQEAQRQAMGKSRSCVVVMTPSNQPKLASNCFQIANYTIKVSAAAISGATTVSVDSLPVAIPSGTGLVFSKGATGVVTQNAAKGSNSLTLSGGISTAIQIGEIAPLRTLQDGVAMATNLSGTPPVIQFSFRGNTTASGKIVVYSSDNSTSKKGCLAISNGTGIMRTGEYSGSTSSTTDITSGTCTTSQ
jgi:prepilin-type N-terminal cleavage/methylation domain-containing protein